MIRCLIGFLSKIFAIFLCCNLVQAKPNDMWGETAITAAYEFLEAVSDRNIDKAYSMLDESFSVDQGTSNSFKNITDKQTFTLHFDRIFNADFIKALKGNLTKELNISGSKWQGRSKWNIKLNQGNSYDEYAVIFNENARPIRINNPTIIAPSFNCLLARSKTEKMLCNNLALSKLDVAVANSYNNAKKYLTGIEYDSLKEDQRAFNKNRNKCASSIDCLKSALSNRNKEITQLIDNEYKKVVKPFDDQEDLTGTWTNEKWINAANCESDSDIKTKLNTQLSIIYKHPYIIMSKKDKHENTTLVCKIKSTSTATYKKLESDNVDKFSWGSCRGDIDRLNYRGSYTYMPLEKVDSVGKTDECENSMIIISGHKGSYQMIYNTYSNQSSENGLAGSGFFMKKSL